MPQDTSVTIKGYAKPNAKDDFVPFSYHPRPLGPNDVEVKIQYCGICASDIHTATGGWGEVQYPIVVGHEIVGIITNKGFNVSDSEFKIGDRVGCGAQCGACCSKDEAKCYGCATGNENHCNQCIFTYNSTYSDGEPSFGGYCSHKRFQKDFCFHIPEKISSPEAGPLMCAGVTVYSPLSRFGPKGKKVGIIGLGGLGHLAVQFASKMGAEVSVIGTSKNKEALAKRLGAIRYLSITEPQELKKFTGYFDFVLCTSNAKGMDWGLYLSLCKLLVGKFCLVAAPEEPLQLPASALFFRRVEMSGSLIGSIKELKEMLQFASDTDVRPMIEILPLSQVNEGIRKVQKNDVKFRVVLEIPQS